MQQVVIGDPVHGERTAPVEDLRQPAARAAQVLHDNQGRVEAARQRQEDLSQGREAAGRRHQRHHVEGRVRRPAGQAGVFRPDHGDGKADATRLAPSRADGIAITGLWARTDRA